MQLAKQSRRIRRNQLNAATLAAATAIQLNNPSPVLFEEVVTNGGKLEDIPGYPEWKAEQDRPSNSKGKGAPRR